MTKINKKRPIYVLDTNVLLYNPRAVYAFPNADVIIPDTVLVELDKIKTSRADRDLRYRGREISRILFELSENGRLTEGIPFGKNSVLQVVNYSPTKGKFDQLSSKNSDDRILSIVNQMISESNGRPVTIVTNDLNMLLKAQAFGIQVEHPGKEFAYSGVKRVFFAAQAKRKSVGTMLAIAVVLVFVAYVINNPKMLGLQQSGTVPAGPPALVQKFQDYQNQVKALQTQRETYEAILKKKPKDLQALVAIGDVYFNLGGLDESPKYFQKAIDNYETALGVDPKQKSVRTNMAIAYYQVGYIDRAISELAKVTKQDDSFYQAHYHLGTILYRNQKDPVAAKASFEKVLKYAPRDSSFAMQADSLIQQINAQLNMTKQMKK
jgi:cytochrome c-type biogenesis protein CcmH/NrfG